LTGLTAAPHNADTFTMTVEEQLRQALVPLADRVRDEIARDLDRAILAATTLARDDRERAAADARAQGWEDGREQGRYEGRQEAEHEAREQLDAARASARTERSPESDGNRLLDAVRAIDRGRSLTEILDTLLGCAAREAGRAGIVLVHHGQLSGWGFIGFDRPVDRETTLSLEPSDAGVLAEAIRTAGVVFGDAPPSFARPLAGEVCAAVPLSIGGEVVAVLYADDLLNRQALEVIARHTARCLEALIALQATHALTQGAEEPLHS